MLLRGCRWVIESAYHTWGEGDCGGLLGGWRGCMGVDLGLGLGVQSTMFPSGHH